MQSFWCNVWYTANISSYNYLQNQPSHTHPLADEKPEAEWRGNLHRVLQSEAGCRPRPRSGILESKSDSCVLEGLSLVLNFRGTALPRRTVAGTWQAGRSLEWMALSASLKITLPPPWPPTTHPTQGKYMISSSS